MLYRSLCVGIGCFALSQPLSAHDIFEYQGGFNRAYGGAGAVMSRGGESVLLNPANLWASRKSDLSADLGLLSLSYKITTPETDKKPGVIQLPVLPLPSLSGSFKTANFAWGAMLFPTGVGTTTKVKGFPVQVNGQYQTVAIEAKQTGGKLGLGMSYRFTDNLSIGASLIYDVFKTDSKIFTTPTTTIRTESDATFIRPILGVRYRLPVLGILAFSYQFPKEYPYDLTVTAFGSPAEKFKRANYRPTVYTLGLHTRRIGPLRLFGVYSYEVWVPATLIAQSPNQALAGDVDVEFLNTHNYVLGSRYKLDSGKQVAFSYSIFSKNKGPGIQSESGELLLNGRGPQDFEALDRYHLTFSLETTSKRSQTVAYGSFIRASALNPEGTPNAGFYELSIYLLGLSYSRL